MEIEKEKESPGPIVFVIEDKTAIGPNNWAVAVRTGKKSHAFVRTECSKRAARRVARLVRRAISIAVKEKKFLFRGLRMHVAAPHGPIGIDDAEVPCAGGEPKTSGKSAQAGTEGILPGTPEAAVVGRLKKDSKL